MRATVFREAICKTSPLTSFDFRTPKMLADDFLRDEDQQKVKGYDHAFLLQALGDAKSPAAHVWSQDEKLQMTVYTSAPALQFYSGNYLAGTPSRTGQPYADWQGLALESEFLPDSPTIPNGRSRLRTAPRQKSTSA